MAQSKLEILIEANDKASEALDKLKDKYGGLFDATTKVGVGMAAVGGAITASMGLAVKSSRQPAMS